MNTQRDNGQQLLLLAFLLSIQIAPGRSVEEISLLSALFTVLGDNLALLATTRLEVEELLGTAEVETIL